MNASTINVNFHHQIIYKHSDNWSTTLLHGIIATCTQIQGVRRNDAHSRIKQTVPPQISIHNRLLKKNDKMADWDKSTCTFRAGQQIHANHQLEQISDLSRSWAYKTIQHCSYNHHCRVNREQTNQIEHNLFQGQRWNTQDSYQFVIAISPTIASLLPTAMQF